MLWLLFRLGVLSGAPPVLVVEPDLLLRNRAKRVRRLTSDTERTRVFANRTHRIRKLAHVCRP